MSSSFAKPVPCAQNNRPQPGVSQRGAVQHEKEKAGRQTGYQIPSQTT
ncbi:hypothetical protein [Novosphingobium sp. PhB55]|nr:hypothetical protein [Novosphingobium sp. PhB55]